MDRFVLRARSRRANWHLPGAHFISQAQRFPPHRPMSCASLVGSCTAPGSALRRPARRSRARVQASRGPLVCSASDAAVTVPKVRRVVDGVLVFFFWFFFCWGPSGHHPIGVAFVLGRRTRLDADASFGSLTCYGARRRCYAGIQGSGGRVHRRRRTARGREAPRSRI